MKETQIETMKRYHYALTMMAKILNTGNVNCWQSMKQMELFTHCLCKCKMFHLLQKTVSQFQIKLSIHSHVSQEFCSQEFTLKQGCPTFWHLWATLKDEELQSCLGPHIKYIVTCNPKKSHNVSSKFMILCWVEFIAILSHGWPGGHGLDTLALKNHR